VIAESRILKIGLTLPAPWKLPDGVKIPAALVRIYRDRALVSGHVPLDGDGRLAGPFGKVGRELALEQARDAARLAMLAVLSSLKRALGDLDRIQAWLRVYGMVNAAEGFRDFPLVLNPASELINEVFGPVVGEHSRVAIGVGGLPWDAPVEIETEVALRRPCARRVAAAASGSARSTAR
jgi:enamine deaminase RidA (YjgF/YER057c/UK114 family)